VYHVERTVLPAAHAEQEPKDIGLLLFGDLFDVLEGSHLAFIVPCQQQFPPISSNLIPAMVLLFFFFTLQRIAELRSVETTNLENPGWVRVVGGKRLVWESSLLIRPALRAWRGLWASDCG